MKDITWRKRGSCHPCFDVVHIFHNFLSLPLSFLLLLPLFHTQSNQNNQVQNISSLLVTYMGVTYVPRHLIGCNRYRALLEDLENLDIIASILIPEIISMFKFLASNISLGCLCSFRLLGGGRNKKYSKNKEE